MSDEHQLLRDQDDGRTFMTYEGPTEQCIFGPFSALGKLSEADREKLVERFKREERLPVADSAA